MTLVTRSDELSGKKLLKNFGSCELLGSHQSFEVGGRQKNLELCSQFNALMRHFVKAKSGV